MIIDNTMMLMILPEIEKKNEIMKPFRNFYTLSPYVYSNNINLNNPKTLIAHTSLISWAWMEQFTQLH